MMVIVPLGGSVVVGVKVKVSLTLALFKRRSRGSMTTLAADNVAAETFGSSRSCRAAAAAMAQASVCILGPTPNERLYLFNEVIESQVSLRSV